MIKREPYPRAPSLYFSPYPRLMKLDKVWTAPIFLLAIFLAARLLPCFLCVFFAAMLYSFSKPLWGQAGVVRLNDQEGAASRFFNLRVMYHLWRGGLLRCRTPHPQGENFSSGGNIYHGTRHFSVPAHPATSRSRGCHSEPAAAGRISLPLHRGGEKM